MKKSTVSAAVPTEEGAVVFQADGMSALGEFGELSSADAQALAAAPVAESLAFEHYVSLPRVSLNPMLSVLDSLTRLVTSLSGKDVHIEPREDFVEFRYVNSDYSLLYRVPNITAKVFPAFVMKVEHLKKLVGTVDSHLVLVWDKNKAQSGVDMFIHVAGSLIDIEKVQFDSDLYNFNMPELPESLDGNRLSSLLPDFASLLSQSERPSERQLINCGPYSYINIGGVLGRADSFCNEHTCILSRALVGNIVSLVNYAGDLVTASFSDDHLELCIGGLCYFRFMYVSGTEMVERFVSPMFKSAFLYDSSVRFDSASLSRVLAVIGTLDYFSDSVKLTFGSDSCRLTVSRTDAKQSEFEFKYTAGSVQGGSLVVPIPVLLSVLAKVTDDTKFACQDNMMIIDTGEVVYCVRSVQVV